MFGAEAFGELVFGEGQGPLVAGVPGVSIGYAILAVAVVGVALAATSAEGETRAATEAEGSSVPAAESEGRAVPAYGSSGYTKRSGT